MKKRKAIHGIKVEESTGNVYGDIGARDPEAMPMKAQLVTKIDEIIKRKGPHSNGGWRTAGLAATKSIRTLTRQFQRNLGTTPDGLPDSPWKRCASCCETRPS